MSDHDGDAGPGPRPEPTSDWLRATNEFTSVEVRAVRTRNGERIEVRSRKMDTSVLLDPLELESLTWQTHESLSRLLEHPYGPEEVDARPLSSLLGDESDVRFPADGDGDADGDAGPAEGDPQR